MIGLVGGWVLPPVVERLTGTAPIVTWVQALALVFVGAILAFLGLAHLADRAGPP